MIRIEWEDVQCIVRRAMVRLDRCDYVLLRIRDPKLARDWLAGLDITSGADTADPARKSAPACATNIAFTFPGLCALGFDPQAPGGFSREFCEGMAPPPRPGDSVSRRSGMLGDVGDNDPGNWRWGGYRRAPTPGGGKGGRKQTGIAQDEIHILLIVFGTSTAPGAAEQVIARAADTDTSGLTVLETLTGWLPEDKREHFGFRDGLSQPKLREEAGGGGDARLHRVAAGEFLIGYRNERGNLPITPRTRQGADLGRNGSYLVFRQLSQDVRAFEDWLDDAVRSIVNYRDPDLREWLAAKVIGRWRSGAPLTRYPDRDGEAPDAAAPFDHRDPAQANDFYYRTEDFKGVRCPLGAHVRRAWPRDGLGSEPQRALLQAQLHRILRRGRLYGPAYDRNAPDSAVNAQPRGLLFICLNADISGQFEAVQHNWLNNPKFSGLSEERDPLVGESGPGSFVTIPGSPTNMRIEGLTAFVTMVGGGYFFLPGLRALKRLATLAETGARAAAAGGVT